MKNGKQPDEKPATGDAENLYKRVGFKPSVKRTVMKTQELNQQEQKNINGGSLLGNGLLGNDSNVLTAVTQGYLDISNTDDNGQTSSTHVGYGSGSIFSSEDGRRGGAMM